MIRSVLYLEWLRESRRQHHIMRWYSGWLMIQFGFLYLAYRRGIRFGWLYVGIPLAGSPLDRHATSEFVTRYFEVFSIQQLLLIMLATPVFVTGAITDEKARGTLQYLFTADLTSAEILVGKLLGRLGQMTFLVLAGLPVLCLIGGLAGLDWFALVSLNWLSLIIMFGEGCASLLASVWCRRTRDAVLCVYGAAAVLYALATGISASPLAGIGWSPIRRLQEAMQWLIPRTTLEALTDTGDPAEIATRLLGATLMWGIIGAVCIALAIWRLRPAYVRQLENEGRKGNFRSAEPKAVGSDPIFWKEWQVDGIAPLAALRRVPRWAGIAAVFGVTLISSTIILLTGLPGDVSSEFYAQALLALLVSSMIVAVRASGAITGEREKRTWDGLLVTPLETRDLVRGKLWGIMGAPLPYLAAYAIPAAFLSGFGGGLALLYTLGLLLAAPLAMYFTGATGLRCSAHAKTSWGSLLSTLITTYIGGYFVIAIASLICLLGICVLVSPWLKGPLILPSMALAPYFVFLVLVTVFFARKSLQEAEKCISRERTQHRLPPSHEFLFRLGDDLRD